MLSKEEAKEVLLTALSQGGDFAEIFMERTKSATVILDDGKIEKLLTGVDQGVGIRVIDKGETYFSNSNAVDFQGIKNFAEKLAEGMGKSALIKEIEFRERNLPVFSRVEISPDTVDIEKKIKLLTRADKAARKYDSRVIQVSGRYIDISQEVLIANSEGLFDTDTRIYPVFVVRATVKKEEMIQTGYEVIAGTQGFEIFNEHSVEEASQEAARSAIFQLEAEPAPAGTYQVVILSEANAGVVVHEAVGHGLEGDYAGKGNSIFADKIGEKVASEIVTVIDDRTIPNSRGTAKIDDEGCPVQRVVLIENGILKGYLQDRKSAKEMGVKPTGNGRRESFRHLPIVRMGTTFIAAGKTNPQEIIDSLKAGIIVKKMSGGGQVDPLSGQFMFGIAEAFLVKDGKRTPIRGASLIGNGSQVLKDIVLVGNDLKFASGGTCGKQGQGVPVNDGLPTIKISKMVIGGIVEEEEK